MSNQASSSSAMGMSHLNSSFDNDLDNFLELDQNNYSTATPSPAVGKAVPSLSQRPSLSSSSGSFASSQSQQTFSGPSFQYESYKQQTGLPVGGLANTFAVNRANGLQYNTNTGYVMPAETLNIPLSSIEDFDYGRTPSLDMNDMDFEDDSPSDLPPMFYPQGGDQFINPTTLASQDDSPTYTTPVQRMYPGMHSQQAAQAKAQQAQKQQHMLRQQQQEQQRALAGQRPLPSTNGKAPAQKDPVVEESISRLLNQMRQNSVASIDEEGDTPTNSSGLMRIKKDEDEMDEDERLLASEEGKKLSSKERRQLRNKVSARAFRSRRKEYIGQLEGELASRTQEATDLKVQNRQLMEENTRLTDLTRMLLSSQAFSGFLSELSASGLPAPAQLNSQTQPAPVSQPTRKDINPHQAARQLQSQQPQVNMVLLPESATDLSILDTPFNGWNSGLASNDFQVFSVTEMPEAPIIDIAKLSGKSEVMLPWMISTPSKATKVELPSLPEAVIKSETTVTSAVDPDVELDEETFTLYFDSSVQTTSSISSNPTRIAQDKYELVLEPSEPQETLEQHFNRMCAALDASCERLALLTPHV